MEDGVRNEEVEINSPSNRGVPVGRCRQMIEKSLSLPKVKYLREQLAKSGCRIGDNFIKAVVCKQAVTGGFIRGKGIVICSNHMAIQDEVNQVVIHELIHAYDDCRAKNLAWTNCAHQACSEIRANHLSGDCYFLRELLRGHYKVQGHEQDCIRRRVMMSMAHNPFCPQVAAKYAMEGAWDVCYNDSQPFDKAP